MGSAAMAQFNVTQDAQISSKHPDDIEYTEKLLQPRRQGWQTEKISLTRTGLLAFHLFEDDLITDEEEGE